MLNNDQYLKAYLNTINENKDIVSITDDQLKSILDYYKSKLIEIFNQMVIQFDNIFQQIQSNKELLTKIDSRDLNKAQSIITDIKNKTYNEIAPLFNYDEIKYQDVWKFNPFYHLSCCFREVTIRIEYENIFSFCEQQAKFFNKKLTTLIRRTIPSKINKIKQDQYNKTIDTSIDTGFKDMFNNPIKIGDFVIYTFKNSYLFKGIVVKCSINKLSIQRDFEHQYINDIPTSDIQYSVCVVKDIPHIIQNNSIEI